ncbi:hypothetical protein HDU76_006909, partial [Blyttiomyces sp. JEL0837]
QEAIKVLNVLDAAAKTSQKTLNINTLMMITANQGTYEAFKHLWKHCINIPELKLIIPRHLRDLSPTMAMTMLITFDRPHDFKLDQEWEAPCPQSLRHAHQYQQSVTGNSLGCTSTALISALDSAIQTTPSLVLPYIKTICKSGHHIDPQCMSDIILKAASSGNLDFVEYLDDINFGEGRWSYSVVVTAAF